MSKHTPGPWSDDAQAGSSAVKYGHIYSVSWPDRMVADAYGRNQVEIAANARLIAAAPDLLAALEGLLECGPGYGCEVAAGKCCHHVATARAAIAKARGEQC